MADEEVTELTINEIDKAKILCEECFPVDYPDSWFQKTFTVAENVRRVRYGIFDSLHENLVAILVAEIQPIEVAEREGVSLDQSCCRECTPLAVYISILGVTQSQRCKGYGTKLLDHLLLNSSCVSKIVYLHVQSTNFPALGFYLKHGFSKLSHLREYYLLKDGCFSDGVLCVKYINGGKPSPPFSDKVVSFAKVTGFTCIHSLYFVASWTWCSLKQHFEKYFE